MVRVLVVDDSAVMRRLLSEMLSSDPDIEVIGVASDPLIAREMIKALNPDVLTLDIEMPRLDGLTFLEHLMRLRPMPVVMISALTQNGAEATLQALEIGAVDFIAKPKLDLEHGLLALRDEVVAKVKAATKAAVHASRRSWRSSQRAAEMVGRTWVTNRIVAIGASTGGVVAMLEILRALPKDGPPILIAQHMPAAFTRQFAKRLNDNCAMSVIEPEDNARVFPGQVCIAPGDRHMSLIRSGGAYSCRLVAGDRVNGHIPSVDVLFGSVAVAAGANAVGILLTGMGRDGAVGLGKMRNAGAATACQDEASSVVYGMPKAAMDAGAAARELPLSKVAAYILEQTSAAQPRGGRDTATSEPGTQPIDAGPK